MNSRNLIFFSIISFLFLIAGQLLWGRQGLLLGFLIASAFNYYIYFFSEKRILRFFSARELIGQDIWGLDRIIKDIAKTHRYQPPKILMSPQKKFFSLTLSRGWGHNFIILTEDLLNELSKEEAQDLLTLHSYYANTNLSFFLGFRTTLCEVFFILSQSFDFLLNIPLIILGAKDSIVFFQRALAPVIGFIQGTFHKDLKAMDEDVAKIIGSKDRYARLLWKLHSLNHNHPIVAPPSCALLYPINPLTSNHLDPYFQKHQSIQERIKLLTGAHSI